MGEDTNYGGLQNPAAVYGNSNKPASPYTGKHNPSQIAPSTVPQVEFVFHVVSSAETDTTKEFIEASMSLVQFIWTPREEQEHYEMTNKFVVRSKWGGSYKIVDDKDLYYRLIDFPIKGAAEKALTLVNDNWSNPNLDPHVPVFVCAAAWNERNEPGSPRDGHLAGYTILNTEKGFGGERAILLFSSSAGPKTLAHELSHWCGFTHGHFSEDPGNIGYIGGGGFDVHPEQLRKYYRWASQVSFRKTIGSK